MKIPIMPNKEDKNWINDIPIGFVSLSQYEIDLYAKGLLDLDMAFEKKWNEKTKKFEIIAHSFSFCPRLNGDRK